VGRNKFGKSGHELADAFEEIANSPGITTEEALEILEIDLEPGIADTLPELDADQLHAAAAAIRAGAIPALWPWIWYIPWISYAPPGGDSS
jgi:hypothetical protein